jgi:NAD+ kinase
MSMPKNLFLIRHGESEGNLANRRSRAGDHSAFTPAFRKRASSEWRLTESGVLQAQSAGLWLRDNFSEIFFRLYASEYIRAVETAYHLGIDQEDVEWFLDMNLRERDYGSMDVLTDEERRELFGREMQRREISPFLWSPPGGESIAKTCERADRVLATLHRECADKNVCIVCHGEMMWAFMVRIERMSHHRYLQLHFSDHPYDHFNNAQILQYTRQSPDDAGAPMTSYLNWRRSICPWDASKSPNKWERIERPRYSRDDLCRLFGSVPRLVED